MISKPLITIRRLAFLTVGFAYALTVLGAVVRITNSGMGCGDDWPLCNGRIVPTLDNPEVIIEWAHRLSVLGLSLFVIALAAVTYLRRHEPKVLGPGGVLRPVLLAVLIFIVQVMLGAVTVWLELRATAVVLHLGAALALLAVLMVVGLRAGESSSEVETPNARWKGAGLAALALGGAALLAGGLTANLGAGPSCLGFPLCSGQVWPASAAGSLPHIHWTHRLVAYALLLHVLGLAFVARRRGAPQSVKNAIWIALIAVTAQVTVAAVMVLSHLPQAWRTAHAALGAALWIALVYLTWTCTRRSRAVMVREPEASS